MNQSTNNDVPLLSHTVLSLPAKHLRSIQKLTICSVAPDSAALQRKLTKKLTAERRRLRYGRAHRELKTAIERALLQWLHVMACHRDKFLAVFLEPNESLHRELSNRVSELMEEKGHCCASPN